MNIKNNVFLGIDTAYQHGMVILFSKEHLWFAADMPEKMAHGRQICLSIDHALAFAYEKQLSLSGVFVGLGPGSFVGVRIALATALGFSYGRNIPLMGFCSHRALAYSVIPEHDKFYIYMKASGDVGYATQFVFSDNELQEVSPSLVVSIDQFTRQCAQDGAIFTDHPHLLVNKGPHMSVINGPSAHGLMQAALSKLAGIGHVSDESASIKPNYLKEPNISEPKRNFVIASR